MHNGKIASKSCARNTQTDNSHDECKKKRFALDWSGVEEAAPLQMN